MKKLILIMVLLVSFVVARAQEKPGKVAVNTAASSAGKIEYLDPSCVRITGLAPAASDTGILPAAPAESGKPQVMINGKPAAPGEYIIANGGMTAIRTAPAGTATALPCVDQGKQVSDARVRIPDGTIADTTRLRSGIVTGHK
jgi:hypothetical protein